MTQNPTPLCCTDKGNRRLVSIATEGPVTRKVEQCSACGRKHYIIIVPPVDVTVAGADMG